MSDLFGNPEDRFSRVAAQISNFQKVSKKGLFAVFQRNAFLFHFFIYLKVIQAAYRSMYIYLSKNV